MRNIILSLVAAATLSSSVFASEVGTGSKFSVEGGSLNGTGDVIFGLETQVVSSVFTSNDSFLISAKASTESQAEAKITYKTTASRVYMTNSIGFEQFATNEKDSKSADIVDSKGNVIQNGELIKADKTDTQMFYEAAIGTDMIRDYGYGSNVEMGYKIGTEKHEVFMKYETLEIIDNTTMTLTLARSFTSNSDRSDETTGLIGFNYKF